MAQSHWAASSIAPLSSQRKSLSLHPIWTSCVSNFVHCLPSSLHVPLWRAWFHLLHLPPAGRAVAVGPPEALPAAGWPSPTPTTSPPRANAPVLITVGPTYLIVFVNAFPVLGGLKLGAVSGCVLAVLSRGQCSLWSIPLFMPPTVPLPSPGHTAGSSSACCLPTTQEGLTAHSLSSLPIIPK